MDVADAIGRCMIVNVCAQIMCTCACVYVDSMVHVLLESSIGRNRAPLLLVQISAS